MTWLVVGHAAIQYEIYGPHGGYEKAIVALGPDAVLAILWLSTLASVAARLSSFFFAVSYTECFGSHKSISYTENCIANAKKRVPPNEVQNKMATIAGLSGLLL